MDTLEANQEQDNASLVESICKRRSAEIFELVCRENEISRTKKKELNLSSVFDAKNESSEDDKDFLTFQWKEKRKLAKQACVFSRKKARNALRILENRNIKKKSAIEPRCSNLLRKYCSKNVASFESRDAHERDISMYILQSIEECIVTRNWNNLTDLLLWLIKLHTKDVWYLKEVMLLSLNMTLSDFVRDVLEEFHQMFTSRS